MAVWDDVIPQEDRLAMMKAGFSQRQTYGSRPALLVVDVKYGFVGDRPEPILKSIERFPRSCGERGWESVFKIKELLAAARRNAVPVFFTTDARRRDGIDAGQWAAKNARALEEPALEGSEGTQIVREVAPLAEEVIIFKKKPSAFFGTPLISYLTGLHVDTVLIAGTTTSGCVRATAVDAFSYNFTTMVVEECVFDRSVISHKVTLFDLNAKYADVVNLTTAVDYLERVGTAKVVPQAG